MKKVMAVVVTYNRLELLKECIESLINQTYNFLEILVVDNNSTDGTEEFFTKSLYRDNKKIHYIKLKQNIGGAGGFHEGIKLASNMSVDWAWLMDDDTIPNANALEELLNAEKEIDNKIGFLASNVYGIQKERMNTPRMKLFQKSENGYADWNEKLSESLVKVETATFCSILISIKAIKQIGLPIKSYFIWGDDTEYTMRLSKYYGQGWLVGKSEVLHKRANAKALSIVYENRKERIDMFFYYYRNNLINLKLYYGVFMSIGYIGFSMFHIFKIIFLKNNFKIKKIKTILKAVFCFILGVYPKKDIKERFLR